jgi:hypothetical protein
MAQGGRWAADSSQASADRRRAKLLAASLGDFSRNTAGKSKPKNVPSRCKRVCRCQMQVANATQAAGDVEKLIGEGMMQQPKRWFTAVARVTLGRVRCDARELRMTVCGCLFPDGRSEARYSDPF